MDKIKLIKQYVVKAVRKDQAQIEIFFAGNLSPFLEAVKKEGLFLSPAEGDLWSLRDIKDVSKEEIEGFKLPSSSRKLEAEDLPPLPTSSLEEDKIDNQEEEINPLLEEPKPSIPIMKMNEYQLIPSITQPESSELLETNISPIGGAQ